MRYAPLRLRKHEERRLRGGHVWVYSNEIDVAATPLHQFTPGQLVQVETSQGKPIGFGYINPRTLLCARLLTRDSQPPEIPALLEQRLQNALALRTALFPHAFYRWVYGEGDGLPGLIVDRYGEHLVVQITTAGMEALREPLLMALQRVIQPRSILLRNDHGMRVLEGLESQVTQAYGVTPARITLEENGVPFTIDPWEGQKSGWFYDHRANRAQLRRYVAGKRVLDVFSYVGGWAIQAAVSGAQEVWAIDSSAQAMALLRDNAVLNQVTERVHSLVGDAFTQLKELYHSGQRFDVIILDPPAFIKKRKDSTAGLAAYRRLNEAAMRLLNKPGWLISASCSHHLSQEQLRQLVLAAGLAQGRDVQIVAQGHQDVDHPIHPAIEETEYLKALFCRL